jgi:Protein of unknown function (DUF2442)
MSISAPVRDARVADVKVTDDALTVTLRDGRRISAPLSWFSRLQRASPADRAKWQPAAAGHGIPWPDIDEDLGIDGLLRGERSP